MTFFKSIMLPTVLAWKEELPHLAEPRDSGLLNARGFQPCQVPSSLKIYSRCWKSSPPSWFLTESVFTSFAEMGKENAAELSCHHLLEGKTPRLFSLSPSSSSEETSKPCTSSKPPFPWQAWHSPWSLSSLGDKKPGSASRRGQPSQNQFSRTNTLCKH